MKNIRRSKHKVIVLIAVSMVLLITIGCARGRYVGRATGTAREEIWEEAVLKETIIAEPKPLEYTIGAGDVLDISVKEVEGLSTKATVLPDGRISYPQIGMIYASGLTLTQLGEEIVKGLSDYVVEPEDLEYTIGVNDVLGISVWREPDLSVSVMVRPDGKIPYPFLGDILVAGLTFTQLKEEIEGELQFYIKNPQVSIMLAQYGRKMEAVLEREPEVSVLLESCGGKIVLVMGEVNSPGVHKFERETRLVEAIALAGGFTKVAVTKNVLIIRGDIRKKPTIILANVVDVFKRGDLRSNIPIRPYDIIYVPRTLIGNVNVFLEQITPTLTSIVYADTLGGAFKD